MKRSRRVVLTMMGTAAVTALTTRFAAAQTCGPGLEPVPSLFGEPDCRPLQHGFGGAVHHVHGHAGG